MQDVACENGTGRTQLVGCDGRTCRRWSRRRAVATGICYLYVPHTTAAITINECADPDVARDVEGALDWLIPATGARTGTARVTRTRHVKGVLVGTSQIIHVESGKLVLGRWQGVFFCGV